MGALVLLGDVGKTALALALCRFWLAPVSAWLEDSTPVWAPFWAIISRFETLPRRKGRGSHLCSHCAGFAPLGRGGILSGRVGGRIAFSGYLLLGAVLIPCLFIIPAFAVHGVEPGILSAVLAILMVIRHIHGLERIASHTEKKFGQRRT